MLVNENDIIVDNADKQVLLKDLKSNYPKFVRSALSLQGETFFMENLDEAK